MNTADGDRTRIFLRQERSTVKLQQTNGKYSTMNSERDPNYRGTEAYEYGDVREITLKCLFARGDCILWSASYEKDGRIETIGGCPGPFEALMWVLEKSRK